MKRIACWFLGHRYLITHRSWRMILMGAFSPLAGARAVCKRCHHVQDDLPYGRMVSKTTGKIIYGPDELSP